MNIEEMVNVLMGWEHSSNKIQPIDLGKIPQATKDALTCCGISSFGKIRDECKGDQKLFKGKLVEELEKMVSVVKGC